jgi:predicted DNA-binding transcriptional regulator
MRNVIHEFERILRILRFKPSDAKIYSLLLEKGEMRVSEIARELNLSARFVRERLKDLCKRGIVSRKFVEQGWMGYTYRAENPTNVLKKLKSSIMKEIEALEDLLKD